jgi:CRP/FNR family transcriptional regulator, anaerobic regulatory protein
VDTSICPPDGPVACSNCDLNAICRLTGRLIAFESGRHWRAAGAMRSLRSGATLYSAGSPATTLFAIRSGMIKRVEITIDGEERVVSFHTPGEVLGLEAFGSGTYDGDAIALGPVQCCELPIPALADESPRTAALATQFVQLLGRTSALRPSFARGTARQRVTSFLLDLAHRMRARGFNDRELHLRMSRLEIANLLDTRIETVSRTLQQLHRERAISVSGSRVTIRELRMDN